MKTWKNFLQMTKNGFATDYSNRFLVKVVSLKNRKHLLESNLQTIIIDATEQPIRHLSKIDLCSYGNLGG